MPDLTFTDGQHACLATTHVGQPCGPECLWYPCSDPMEDRCASPGCHYMRCLHTTDGSRDGGACRQFT